MHRLAIARRCNLTTIDNKSLGFGTLKAVRTSNSPVEDFLRTKAVNGRCSRENGLHGLFEASNLLLINKILEIRGQGLQYAPVECSSPMGAPIGQTGVKYRIYYRLADAVNFRSFWLVADLPF